MKGSCLHKLSFLPSPTVTILAFVSQGMLQGKYNYGKSCTRTTTTLSTTTHYCVKYVSCETDSDCYGGKCTKNEQFPFIPKHCICEIISTPTTESSTLTVSNQNCVEGHSVENS